MTYTDDPRGRAAKRADAKLSFLIHLAFFAVFIAGQTVMELLLTPGRLTVQYTAMGWGVGVLIHGLLAYARVGSIRERMIDAELRRGRA